METLARHSALVTAVLVTFSVVHASYLVETDCGKVEGRAFPVTTDSGKRQEVYEFLNIPYAAPPTGHLRWRAPVGLKDYGACWNGTLKYNDNVIQCVQIPDGARSVQGKEDCLILSVRTPFATGNKKLPVLVWIHGGGMITGHSRFMGYYPDSQFTASMEVVSVSINYRLNVFGFLSLEELWEKGEGGGYGNYGIMDQILALRWIKKNINNFGGNPNDVTIFGESGGGTATYCLLSASLGMSKGLFHKIIASSGVPNIRTTHIEANQMNRPFLNKTKCLKHSKEDTQKCLRALNASAAYLGNPGGRTFIDLDYEFTFPFDVPTKGMPLQIIDPLVIKYSPTELISHLHNLRQELRIDILMGNMALDAIFVNPSAWPTWTVLKKQLEPRVKSFKNCSYNKLLALYLHKSRAKFMPAKVTPFYMYGLMTADIHLSCATTELAFNLTRYRPFKVYSYIVSQALSPFKNLTFYAAHCFDVIPLFNFGILQWFVPGYVPSKEDMILKHNLRSKFKQFIHSSKRFEMIHRSRTMEFWNSSVHTWKTPYHERECKFLRKYGFLKHSWGNRGIWNN